jgi:tRNA pseudouridine synthase 10
MFEIGLENIERAAKALEQDLCDHCLGRVFAHVSTGFSNDERGAAARKAVNDMRVNYEMEPLEYVSCSVCEDIFLDLDRFAEAVALEVRKIECHNFLVGTRVDPVIQSREESLWSRVGQETAEPIKVELNREIGKRASALLQKEVEFKAPEVVALVDTRFAHVELDIAPLFVYGRYNKFSREIPQTKWPCRECRGKGCKRCDGTGKMYQTSVQEIIGDPLLAAAEGKEHFLHGMGREDIDARMLGTGRPFVLEVSEPKKRDVDLAAMREKINADGEGRVAVSELRFSSREEVRQVKTDSPEKAYIVDVRFKDKVNKDRVIEVVRSLDRTPICQQTPVRVAHRRADLERAKSIISARVEELSDEGMRLWLRTQSGTYVKEFVHGDGGRTRPSLSELLGVPCEVLALDVVEIIDKETEA